MLFDYASLMDWSEVVPSAVGAFFQKNNIYPNILTANTRVFEKLLKICLEQGIENYHPLTQEEPLILGGYISHEYALEYVPDDRLTEYQFLLVYDQSSNV